LLFLNSKDPYHLKPGQGQRFEDVPDSPYSKDKKRISLSLITVPHIDAEPHQSHRSFQACVL
jgi:hypothetical protein